MTAAGKIPRIFDLPCYAVAPEAEIAISASHRWLFAIFGQKQNIPSLLDCHPSANENRRWAMRSRTL